jgi:cytochrome oxidase Cu insertion factor (SCO1/SenC/PrrC family)
LKAYKATHHLRENWHLLRAPEHETAAIAHALGMRRLEDDTHIDHDVRIAVLDASGNLVRELSGWGFDDSAAFP